VYVLARTELVSMVPIMIPFPGAGVINNITSEIRIVLGGVFFLLRLANWPGLWQWLLLGEEKTE